MPLTISEEQLQLAAEAACEMRNDDIDIRIDYSGRGMYGKTCYGFVADELTLQVLELQLAIFASGLTDDMVEIHDLSEMFLRLGNMRCRDSMGMQTIYYYPQLKVVAEES